MRLRTVLLACLSCAFPALSAQEALPTAKIPALDGHVIALPGDLPRGATVLVFGFSRGSQKETTAWGKRILLQIGRPPELGFFEIADLAPVPGLLRGMITRSMRKSSPPSLHPYFLTLTQNDSDWKRLAGYTSDAPDAAYVVLIDQKGTVHWKTHAPDSDSAAAALAEQVRLLRASSH